MLCLVKEATKIRMAYFQHSAVWVSFWKIRTCLKVKICFTYERQDYLDNQWTVSIYNVTEGRFLSTIPRKRIQVKP